MLRIKHEKTENIINFSLDPVFWIDVEMSDCDDILFIDGEKYIVLEYIVNYNY